MTSAAPSATSAGSQRAGHPAIAAGDRGRHPHDRHDRRAGADLGRFPPLYVDRQRRRPVSDAAKPVELDGPDLLDRHHGDRHGADHRDAPHRPFGRIDRGLRLDDHRRRAGPRPAGLSRPRQSGDLDHRGRSSRGDRRGDRRLSRLARRLSRHSGLHRHARRPIVLARRRVVGDDGSDDRAARRPLRADGRWPAWLDRGDGELGAGRARLRRHRVRLVLPAARGGRGFVSRNGRCGRNT